MIDPKTCENYGCDLEPDEDEFCEDCLDEGADEDDYDDSEYEE